VSFYAYMLKSSTSQRHYYGHTDNLEERLNEHKPMKHWIDT